MAAGDVQEDLLEVRPGLREIGARREVGHRAVRNLLSAVHDDDARAHFFDEVQQVFAEHQPVVYFAAPRIYVAYASRVRNVTPAVSRPQLLWSPDMLAVAQ